MPKKKLNFKVVKRPISLEEVYGYFKNLETETIFVYFNKSDHAWYVVDLFTGLAISNGKTMREAEEKFCHDLKKYREFKNKEIYLDEIKKYQELKKEYYLKEGKREWKQ